MFVNKVNEMLKTKAKHDKCHVLLLFKFSTFVVDKPSNDSNLFNDRRKYCNCSTLFDSFFEIS